MNRNCKHLKQKLDRTIYCKKKNKTITFKECSKCEYKQYKDSAVLLQSYMQRSAVKHKKNKTISKLERNRYSILGSMKGLCVECGLKGYTECNEVFCGRNRQNSMKYGMCIYLCKKCHDRYDVDMNLRNKWQQKCKKKFLDTHTEEEFIKIFGRSYL